ncbi:MAG: hypothetical protein PHV38_04485 [Eubacteriales bacterium]|jgi:hypothetical protein|nr:hypothetical protein [Eubacteriales bacterium]
MPRKDGTGPFGKGPIAGESGYKGRKGGIGAGPAGYCVCPKCGEKVKHTTGIPCTSIKCPKCGTSLIRDF